MQNLQAAAETSVTGGRLTDAEGGGGLGAPEAPAKGRQVAVTVPRSKKTVQTLKQYTYIGI